MLKRCARQGWSEEAIDVICRLLRQTSRGDDLPTEKPFEDALTACVNQPAIALKLFGFMVEKLAPRGLNVTTFHFNRALEACRRARWDAEAERLFELLLKRGNKPDMKTIRIMLCLRPPQGQAPIVQMAVDLGMLFPQLGYDGRRNVLDLRKCATRPRYCARKGNTSLPLEIASAIVRVLHKRGLLDRETRFKLGAPIDPDLTRSIDAITPWLPDRRADRHRQADEPAGAATGEDWPVAAAHRPRVGR